ncbi:MAG: ABC transporter ATP-binding protein [Clostridiales bacterium]|nr:ABC transporter ATP-binding protein [Clostridiales bacterium]
MTIQKMGGTVKKNDEIRNRLIAAEHLSLSYGSAAPVVSDVSFSIVPGEIFCIVGESGSGKSTLLKAIMNPEEFGVRICGGEIQNASFLMRTDRKKGRGKDAGIGMIFQNPGASFNPVRTYRKQFQETLKSNGLFRGEETWQEVLCMLDSLGLADGGRILDSCPYEMSGGMNQRIAIALTMLLRPRLILADEPTSALDVTLQEQVLDELLRARELYGTAILLVTHNLGVAAKMADRIAVMREGRFVECQSAENVLHSPEDSYTKELLAAVPRIPQNTSKSQSVFSGSRPEGRSGERKEKYAGSCTSPILEVRHLEKSYHQGRRDIHAVQDISFSVHEGEFLGIVGESGSGKSTVLRQIAGLEKPDGGEILLAGEALAPKRTKEDYRRMQTIFQEPVSSFDPRIRIGKSILENQKNLCRKNDFSEEVSGELLKQTGLSADLRDRYPSQLSGGQCQRAAISRAIAVHPKVLLCDEITSALDVSVQARIIRLLVRLAREKGMAVVFVSHDIALVSAICSHILVMKDGACVEYQETGKLMEHPQNEYTRQLLGAVLQV